MENVLEVKNLNVELEGERIIENLSFEVGKGEILTILGPNGAGKTVLLKTLLGILPYRGEIKWKENIKIGYVPQRLPFIKDIPMSIEEFFSLKKLKKETMRDILEPLGFREDFLKRKIGELSSGEFQRVLVAWSLVAEPDILLFDEPTTGIDVEGEERIYNFLRKLKKEKNLTVFLVTHELNVVYQFSDNVLCLSKRGFCCYGKPREILTPNALEKIYGTEIRFYEHK